MIVALTGRFIRNYDSITCPKGQNFRGVGFVSERQTKTDELPAKIPKRIEPKQVSFRVSEQDYLKLSQSAKTLNMSVASFAKKKAQNARLVTPKISSDDAKKIAYQLSMIGNNLNQLTKLANEGSSIDTQSLRAIKEQVDDIWQQLI